MPAINDVTGDTIQSRALSSSARDSWDHIFIKKSAFDWIQSEGIDMVNFAGWDSNESEDKPIPLSKVISKTEFDRRIEKSKIRYRKQCLPIPNDINISPLCLILERNGLNRGRLLSQPSDIYADLNPDNEIIFNASVWNKAEGKIWHGSLDLTEDLHKLKKAALDMNEKIYVLDEEEGRFENCSLTIDRMEMYARLVITPEDGI